MWVWYPRTFRKFETLVMKHLLSPITILNHWRRIQQSKLAFEMWVWYPRTFRKFETSMMKHLLRPITILNYWRIQWSKLAFEMWVWYLRTFRKFETSMMKFLLRMITILNHSRKPQQSKSWLLKYECATQKHSESLKHRWWSICLDQ